MLANFLDPPPRDTAPLGRNGDPSLREAINAMFRRAVTRVTLDGEAVGLVRDLQPLPRGMQIFNNPAFLDWLEAEVERGLVHVYADEEEDIEVWCDGTEGQRPNLMEHIPPDVTPGRFVAIVQRNLARWGRELEGLDEDDYEVHGPAPGHRRIEQVEAVRDDIGKLVEDEESSSSSGSSSSSSSSASSSSSESSSASSSESSASSESSGSSASSESSSSSGEDDCGCDDSHASVDLDIPSDITSSSVAKLPAGTYNLTQTLNRCTDGPDPNAYLYDGAHEATDGSFWVMEVIYGLDEKGDVFCMDAYIYNVSAGDNELIYQNNTTLGEYDDPTVPADITAHPTTVEVAEVP